MDGLSRCSGRKPFDWFRHQLGREEKDSPSAVDKHLRSWTTAGSFHYRSSPVRLAKESTLDRRVHELNLSRRQLLHEGILGRP